MATWCSQILVGKGTPGPLEHLCSHDALSTQEVVLLAVEMHEAAGVSCFVFVVTRGLHQTHRSSSCSTRGGRTLPFPSSHPTGCAWQRITPPTTSFKPSCS
eukprot:713754_1